MARNSRKLPSAGFGAVVEDEAAAERMTAPAMATMKPIRVFLEICSLRTKWAAMATSRGSSAQIIPAWDASVYERDRASKIKYKPGSHRPMNRNGFQSPGW